MHQIPLPVQLRPEADFSAFVVGPNDEAVAAVAAWAAGTGDHFIYLFGTTGSGKTHLLHAACWQAVQGDRSAIYLPLKHGKLAPSALDNLELWNLVALDDIQTIAGNATWEEGLFDLYNRLRESGQHLLVSGHVPVSELPLTLPDLRSRLGWGVRATGCSLCPKAIASVCSGNRPRAGVSSSTPTQWTTSCAVAPGNRAT